MFLGGFGSDAVSDGEACGDNQPQGQQNKYEREPLWAAWLRTHGWFGSMGGSVSSDESASTSISRLIFCEMKGRTMP